MKKRDVKEQIKQIEMLNYDNRAELKKKLKKNFKSYVLKECSELNAKTTDKVLKRELTLSKQLKQFANEYDKNKQFVNTELASTIVETQNVKFINEVLQKCNDQNCQESQVKLSNPYLSRNTGIITTDKNQRYAIIRKALKEFLNKVKLMNTDINELIELHYFNRQPYQLPEGQAFFAAVKNNNKKLVYKLIVQNKEYIYEIDHAYETGLHWACKRGYVKLAKLLITNGADFDQPNASQITPLYYALRSQNIRMVKLLFYFGATPFGPKQNYYRQFVEGNSQLTVLLKKAICVAFIIYLLSINQLKICLSMTNIEQRNQLWEEQRCYFNFSKPKAKK